jgi:hypothetical protein
MPTCVDEWSYHRLGSPGGPPVPVAALEVMGRGPDGEPSPAHLLDAGTDVSELELLRTVCHGLGINWGRDEFGHWAVVPARLTAS